MTPSQVHDSSLSPSNHNSGFNHHLRAPDMVPARIGRMRHTGIHLPRFPQTACARQFSVLFYFLSSKFHLISFSEHQTVIPHSISHSRLNSYFGKSTSPHFENYSRIRKLCETFHLLIKRWYLEVATVPVN